MALTFTRVLSQRVTAQTINAAASYTSAELDIGANTIPQNVWLYLECDGFAAAPAGNQRLTVTVAPIHTTSGDPFDDFGVKWSFPVTADQQYQFAIPLGGLPRFSKVTVLNDTDQNTDASAVDLWIEYVAVTA